MIKTDDKGFSIIETFLVVVIIGLIGGIGYYVYSAQQKANTNLKQATNSTSAPTTKPKLNAYTDKLAGYTIDYPSNWKVKTSSKYLEYAKADVSTTIATSDTGLTLTFEHNFGGRGGECPPAASDTPFATGNKCPTDEIIYAEKTGHTVLLLDSSMEHPSPV
ncbi:MAG: PsbP-related protein, partial [Candidatus Saccharimonadales bacterium]